MVFQDQAEIDIADKNGKTPLMLAVGRKHEKIIHFLKKESRTRNSLMPKIDIWLVRSLHIQHSHKVLDVVFTTKCSVMYQNWSLLKKIAALTLNYWHQCFDFSSALVKWHFTKQQWVCWSLTRKLLSLAVNCPALLLYTGPSSLVPQATPRGLFSSFWSTCCVGGTPCTLSRWVNTYDHQYFWLPSIVLKLQHILFMRKPWKYPVSLRDTPSSHSEFLLWPSGHRYAQMHINKHYISR